MLSDRKSQPPLPIDGPIDCVSQRDAQSVSRVLRRIAFFAQFDETDLRNLCKHAVTKRIGKNTVMISEGDTTDSLYVILSGHVKIFLSDEEGKEIILNFLGPGDFFGEIALIDEQPRSASVLTLEPCVFSIFRRIDFIRYLSERPAAAVHLLREITRRIRYLTEKSKDLALKDVYGRVVNALMYNARAHDGKWIAEIRTQQDLANEVGATRQMVSRIFKDLSVGEFITVQGKRITINKKLPARW